MYNINIVIVSTKYLTLFLHGYIKYVRKRECTLKPYLLTRIPLRNFEGNKLHRFIFSDNAKYIPHITPRKLNLPLNSFENITLMAYRSLNGYGYIRKDLAETL